MRRDIADIRLAELVFAPHYVEPLPQTMQHAAALRDAPGAGASTLAELAAGDPFELLDITGGVAWGIATRQGLVGYVDAPALGAPVSESQA